MMFFTADLHFYHENAITHSHRCFESATEMNEVLIQNWNTVVSSDDEVYVLGDFMLKGITFLPEIIGKLNGKKYLIKGNHDAFAKSYTCDGFVWVKDYYELKYQNEMFVLSHYPFLSWNRAHYGSFQLHGHIHSTGAYNAENIAGGVRRYDVGVDANTFAPVSVEHIFALYERT